MNTLTQKNHSSVHLATATQLFHMHASRPGPVLSNEIILSIKEYEANPHLKKIIGVQQPSGTVGKFVAYWLGGLPDAVKERIVAGVYGELKGANLLGVLCEQADAVYLSPATFVDLYFLPIYKVYEKEMKLLRIDDAALGRVRSLATTPTFSNVMIQCSLALANIALEKQGYPLIDSIPIPADIFNKYKTTKSVDVGLLKRTATDKLNQKHAQYQHAFDSIAKDLKPYKKCPNSQQLEQLLHRFENNRSHHGIEVLAQDLVYFYENRAMKELQFDDYLACVDDAYRASIVEGPGEVGYVTGEEMVKIIFEMAARSDNAYLATQKFMRGFDYSLYDKLCRDYPALDVRPSAFTTWNTQLFPEFDTNFACALKYLLPKV